MEIGNKVVAVKDGLAVREGFKFSNSLHWDFTAGMTGVVTEMRCVSANDILPTVQMDNGKTYYSCDPADFEVVL